MYFMYLLLSFVAVMRKTKEADTARLMKRIVEKTKKMKLVVCRETSEKLKLNPVSQITPYLVPSFGEMINCLFLMIDLKRYFSIQSKSLVSISRNLILMVILRSYLTSSNKYLSNQFHVIFFGGKDRYVCIFCGTNQL